MSWCSVHITGDIHESRADVLLSDLSLLSTVIYFYIFDGREEYEFELSALFGLKGITFFKLKKALAELERFGYLERNRIREPDGSLSGSEYRFYNAPVERRTK